MAADDCLSMLEVAPLCCCRHCGMWLYQALVDPISARHSAPHYMQETTPAHVHVLEFPTCPFPVTAAAYRAASSGSARYSCRLAHSQHSIGPLQRRGTDVPHVAAGVKNVCLSWECFSQQAAQGLAIILLGTPCQPRLFRPSPCCPQSWGAGWSLVRASCWATCHTESDLRAC